MRNKITILPFLLIAFTISVSAQSITRDVFGRITKIVYSDSAYESYTYDNGGRRAGNINYTPCSLMPVSVITASGVTTFCQGDSTHYLLVA